MRLSIVKVLESIVDCLKNSHNFEHIIYDRENDYSENYPSCQTLHCVDCSEDLAIAPLNDKDFRKLAELHERAIPVKELETIVSFLETLKILR